MDSNQEPKDNQPIADKVSERLRHDHIGIRSPFSIWSERLGWMGFALVAFLASMLVMNALIVWWQTSGAVDLVGYGPPGWQATWHILPVGWLVLLLVLVGLTFLLFRHFDVSYKTPFVMSLLALIVFAFVGGFLANRTGADRPLHRADHLPGKPLKHLYHPAPKHKSASLLGGTVSAVTETGLMVEVNDESIEVVLRPETRQKGLATPKVGDQVRVIGRALPDGKFEADAVIVLRKISLRIKQMQPRLVPLHVDQI